MRAVITCAVALTAFMLLASPANAQGCGEGDIQFCGFVWNDANHDGMQNEDDGSAENGDQSALDGVKVTLFVKEGSSWVYVTDVTTYQGVYAFEKPDSGEYPDGEYKVVVGTPPGMVPTCPGTDPMCLSFGVDNTNDSDGINDVGGAAAVVTISAAQTSQEFDFGFQATTRVSPGTGTPGYWKNHTEVWSTVTIGGTPYDAAVASALMGKVSKDKTISLFSQLVAAKLNVESGNESGCIDARITTADAWLTQYPVGSGVAASTAAWQQIAQTHQDLDDYNNGRLCAPHRN